MIGDKPLDLGVPCFQTKPYLLLLYLPFGNLSHSYLKLHIQFVDLPSKNCHIPQQTASLPEVNHLELAGGDSSQTWVIAWLLHVITHILTGMPPPSTSDFGGAPKPLVFYVLINPLVIQRSYGKSNFLLGKSS